MKVNKIEGILLERNKKFEVAEGDRPPCAQWQASGLQRSIPTALRGRNSRRSTDPGVFVPSRQHSSAIVRGKRQGRFFENSRPDLTSPSQAQLTGCGYFHTSGWIVSGSQANDNEKRTQTPDEMQDLPAARLKTRPRSKASKSSRDRSNVCTTARRSFSL